VQRIANPAYLSRFLFCGLPGVAPYCVPAGVKVVSTLFLISSVRDHLANASSVLLFFFDGLIARLYDETCDVPR
jgi:hypothetical protein